MKGIKACILGPFQTEAIIERLSPADRRKVAPFKGMGGPAVVALVKTRIAAGRPTEIITLDKQATEPVTVDSANLKYTICPRRKKRALRSLYFKERRYICDAISQSDGDVFHANWPYEYGSAALDTSKPVLITVRDCARAILKWNGFIYLPDYYLSRSAFSKAKHIVAVSPYIAEYVQKFTRHQVMTIPNSFPPDLPHITATANSRPDQKQSFCIASALDYSPYKNVRRALEVFAKVKHAIPYAEYHLMGNGLDVKSELHQWSASRGLDAGVTFHGLVSHKLVLDCFANSDIVFHPSLEESFGNPLVEGMALEKLVIATRQAKGCCWVLDNGKAGILADGHSVDDMTSYLLKAHRDKAWAEGIAQKGKAHAVERFSPETVMLQYEDVYRSVLQNMSGNLRQKTG